MPHPYSERLDEAMVFAHRLHQHQLRKGADIPYITHLIGVAALVGDHGGSEAQVIGALLHDAIEDQIDVHPDLRARIASLFGPDVLAIVEACTDADTKPKPPWRARKEAYIAHVEAAPDAAPFLIVSAADKLYNARSIVRDHALIGDEIWARFRNGGEAGTRWYYRELARVFAAKDLGSPLANQLSVELNRTVALMDALGAASA
jgi:(p)ppGpp synthase/HD superfamily hydrolase